MKLGVLFSSEMYVPTLYVTLCCKPVDHNISPRRRASLEIRSVSSAVSVHRYISFALFGTLSYFEIVLLILRRSVKKVKRYL